MIKWLTFQIFLLFTFSTLGQSNFLIGQYFQLMPVFAPALTGANDGLDIRAGMRNQWIGYEGAPKTHFFSATGELQAFSKNNPHQYNSVRVSDMSPYTRKGVRLGIGTYIFDDRAGEVKQLEAMVSTAVHVAVTEKVNLSLGITGGFYNSKLDASLFVLKPQNDDTYQNYLENGGDSYYFKVNSGIAAYSDRFYFSYASLNLVHSLISETSYSFDYSSTVLHTFLGRYLFDLSSSFELDVNAYVRYSADLPLLYNLGVRARYNQAVSAGIFYRNDKSIISMIGFSINGMYNVGYAYERKILNDDNFDLNSHEIIIGMRLFDNKKYMPIW